MNIFSSYKVKIKHYNKIFENTVKIYRDAVSFFIDVCGVENAQDCLKKIATAVIHDNNHDGVAKWLWEHFDKKMEGN